MSHPNDDEKAIENFTAGISESNHDTFCRFLDQKKAAGCKPSTRRLYAAVLARFDQHLNGRPYATATAADVTAFLLVVGERVTQATVAQKAIFLGSFYRFLAPDGTLGRDFALALKVKQPRRLKDVQPLTLGEFQSLLAGDEDLRMQALWWTLWDGGFRINEALALRIGSVELDDKGGARLRIPANAPLLKTGPRTIYVAECVPTLKAWLAIHPKAGDHSAPLFPSFQNQNRGRSLSSIAVYNRMKTLCKTLGLRHIHPHMFRHTRATRAARARWSEAQMRAYFGWSPDSKMPSLYIHLVARDQEDQVRRDAGLSDDGIPLPKGITDDDLDRILTRKLKRLLLED